MEKFPPKDQKRLTEAIISLRDDPFRGKKLLGEYDGKWVIRVWPYRIIYEIEKKTVTVFVENVGHRQGVYHS